MTETGTPLEELGLSPLRCERFRRAGLDTAEAVAARMLADQALMTPMFGYPPVESTVEEIIGDIKSKFYGLPSTNPCTMCGSMLWATEYGKCSECLWRTSPWWYKATMKCTRPLVDRAVSRRWQLDRLADVLLWLAMPRWLERWWHMRGHNDPAGEHIDPAAGI